MEVRWYAHAGASLMLESAASSQLWGVHWCVQKLEIFYSNVSVASTERCRIAFCSSLGLILT